MILSFGSVNAAVAGLQNNGSALWSGLTSGIEASASWLSGTSQASASQLAQFGNQMLDRAAELSRQLTSLAEGTGTATERAALRDAAERLGGYVESTRAAGIDAVAAAGATASNAARQALAGAAAKVAGPSYDAYEYFRDLNGAIEGGDWTKFGGTAAGMGASAAGGAVGAALAAAAIAALASVVAIPGAVAVAVIFGTAAAGAFLGNTLGPTIFDGLERIADWVSRWFSDAQAFTPRRDPLVLDLDADGLELRAADGAVLFDHNADGIRTGTGWVLPDDALLAWDRNANGLIDSGRELFGVDTIKANGQLATDGFDALRELDSNDDGLFSAVDAQFANLRLWRDADQGGLSDAGELTTLAAADIASISLTATPSGALNNKPRGQHFHRGAHGRAAHHHGRRD